MLNDVSIVGRISSEVTISKVKNDTSVISCYIANRRNDTTTDFVKCVFFNQPYLEKKLEKGMKIFVKGRLQQNKYTNHDGRTVTYHQVVGKVLEWWNLPNQAEDSDNKDFDTDQNQPIDQERPYYPY